MSEHSLKKMERFLWGIFALLGLILVIGLILLFQSGKASSDKVNKGEKDVPPTNAENSYKAEGENRQEGLSDSTAWLPQGCALYETLPDVSFQDGGGD